MPLEDVCASCRHVPRQRRLGNEQCKRAGGASVGAPGLWWLRGPAVHAAAWRARTRLGLSERSRAANAMCARPGPRCCKSADLRCTASTWTAPHNAAERVNGGAVFLCQAPPPSLRVNVTTTTQPECGQVGWPPCGTNCAPGLSAVWPRATQGASKLQLDLCEAGNL